MITVLLYALGVVIFLGAIFVSIALHELGHLHYAKKFGCRVSQFMVGFGPIIYSRTKGETEYGVKLIPLGGYVKIIGMFPPETEREHRISRGEKVAKLAAAAAGTRSAATLAAEQDGEPRVLKLRRSNTGLFAQMVSQTRASEFELVEPADENRLFYKLPPSRKILVMLAGPAVNIAIAFACFWAVYGIYGTNDAEPTGSTVVTYVADCVIAETENRTVCQNGDARSPASIAGLEPGDRIVSVNGRDVTTWDALTAYIHDNGDGAMQLGVIRDGEHLLLEPAATVVMDRDLDGTGELTSVGFLGVEPEQQEIVTRHGPVYTMLRMGEMTANAVQSVVDLPARVFNVAQAILGLEERHQDGPISVIGGSRIAGEVTASQAPGLDVDGKAAMLGLVVGSFNLFIGVFNLIPLMPLDGGQIAGAAFEGIRRRLAQVFRRPDPGFVNVAAQLPLAYVLGFALLSMSLVLMLGDIIVPLTSGL